VAASRAFIHVGPSPLITSRLILLPCSLTAAMALWGCSRQAERLFGARLPDGWPTPDLREFLPEYIHKLQADSSMMGWGIWIMIRASDPVVIGDIGFKGKPDSQGMVDIGYGVLSHFQQQGYATEAAETLVEWALAQPDVRRVIAECLPHNLASIRVLEKIGMHRTGHTQDGLLTWERRRVG